MSDFGSMAWIEATGGAMSWFDGIRMVLQAWRVRRRRGSTPLSFLDPSMIRLPDTALALEAMEICRTASRPYLLHHCLRSYYWARLLNDSCKHFDDEALFAATMLHDLGLTDGHRDPDRCFTAVGADAVEKLALRHGWSDRRARLAADAIALHLNVMVGDAHGREAQLLRLGSGADTTGLALRALPKHEIDEVLSLYPRLGLKRHLAPVLAAEAEAKPCCRIAFLQNKFGFAKMVARAPFAD